MTRCQPADIQLFDRTMLDQCRNHAKLIRLEFKHEPSTRCLPGCNTRFARNPHLAPWPWPLFRSISTATGPQARDLRLAQFSAGSSIRQGTVASDGRWCRRQYRVRRTGAVGRLSTGDCELRKSSRRGVEVGSTSTVPYLRYE